MATASGSETWCHINKAGSSIGSVLELSSELDRAQTGRSNGRSTEFFTFGAFHCSCARGHSRAIDPPVPSDARCESFV